MRIAEAVDAFRLAENLNQTSQPTARRLAFSMARSSSRSEGRLQIRGGAVSSVWGIQEEEICQETPRLMEE